MGNTLRTWRKIRIEHLIRNSLWITILIKEKFVELKIKKKIGAMKARNTVYETCDKTCDIVYKAWTNNNG